MNGGAFAFFVLSMKPALAGGQVAAATQGFVAMAWIAPLAVFAAALLGTILLVRRWPAGKMQTEVHARDAGLDVLKRRETGIDGGI
jgi:uncharacterized membrane protein